MSSEKMTVRLAREEDFDQVLQISEGIYDGFDYFPLKFHEWLGSSNNHIFVTELHDKIIGLQVARVMPDRRSFIAQALRIHRDYRGKGLSNQMVLSLSTSVKKMYPELSRELFVLSSRSPQSNATVRALGNVPLLEQVAHTFLVTEPFATPLTSTDHPIYKLSKKDAVGFILNKQNTAALIPQNMAIIGFEPYEILRSNIDLIFQDGDQMFADVSYSEMLQGMKIATSLSHGRSLAQVRMPGWRCTVYTNDKDLYKAHVIRQLTCAIQAFGPQDFQFRVCHPRNFTFDSKDVLLSLLHHDIKITSNVFVLYEKRLDGDSRDGKSKL